MADDGGAGGRRGYRFGDLTRSVLGSSAWGRVSGRQARAAAGEQAARGYQLGDVTRAVGTGAVALGAVAVGAVGTAAGAAVGAVGGGLAGGAGGALFLGVMTTDNPNRRWSARTRAETAAAVGLGLVVGATAGVVGGAAETARAGGRQTRRAVRSLYFSRAEREADRDRRHDANSENRSGGGGGGGSTAHDDGWYGPTPAQRDDGAAAGPAPPMVFGSAAELGPSLSHDPLASVWLGLFNASHAIAIMSLATGELTADDIEAFDTKVVLGLPTLAILDAAIRSAVATPTDGATATMVLYGGGTMTRDRAPPGAYRALFDAAAELATLVRATPLSDRGLSALRQRALACGASNVADAVADADADAALGFDHDHDHDGATEGRSSGGSGNGGLDEDESIAVNRLVAKASSMAITVTQLPTFKETFMKVVAAVLEACNEAAAHDQGGSSQMTTEAKDELTV